MKENGFNLAKERNRRYLAQTITEQRLDNQLEPIYNSSVPIQDVAWRTCREQWMIEMGGKRGSGRSVLAARHDDEETWPS